MPAHSLADSHPHSVCQATSSTPPGTWLRRPRAGPADKALYCPSARAPGDSALDRHQHGRGNDRRHPSPGIDVAREQVRQPIHHPACDRPGVGRRSSDGLEHRSGVAAPVGRSTRESRATHGPQRQRAYSPGKGARTKAVTRSAARSTSSSSSSSSSSSPSCMSWSARGRPLPQRL